MQEIGWIENKEELDGMLKQGQQNDREDDESSDDGGKRGETLNPYANVGPIGAFAPTAPANPFFTGAALTGGHLSQQFSKPEKKKQTATTRGGKPTRRQIERPEKREGRTQAYKKR
jgi:hypothetical protein